MHTDQACHRTLQAALTGWRAAALLVLVLVCGAARADVYGFIDAAGVIHFANTRVDERYTLFFKDGDAFDSDRVGARRLQRSPVLPVGPAGAAVAESRPVESPVLESMPLPDLPQGRIFERVSEHPNLTRYAALIDQVALESGVDAHLIKSVIAVESAYEPLAVSPKGAVGLMQVLPATGERYGLRNDRGSSVEQKLSNPAINLRIGARYLSDLRKMFADDLDLVLAAYNAGENAVKRFRNSIPPFPETQSYVKLVRAFYRFFKPAPPPLPVVEVKQTPVAPPPRVRMTITARRNIPEMVTVPRNEVPQMPGLPDAAPRDVLQVPAVPALPSVADGAHTLLPTDAR